MVLLGVVCCGCLLCFGFWVFGLCVVWRFLICCGVFVFGGCGVVLFGCYECVLCSFLFGGGLVWWGFGVLFLLVLVEFLVFLRWGVSVLLLCWRLSCYLFVFWWWVCFCFFPRGWGCLFVGWWVFGLFGGFCVVAVYLLCWVLIFCFLLGYWSCVFGLRLGFDLRLGGGRRGVDVSVFGFVCVVVVNVGSCGWFVVLPFKLGMVLILCGGVCAALFWVCLFRCVVVFVVLGCCGWALLCFSACVFWCFILFFFVGFVWLFVLVGRFWFGGLFCVWFGLWRLVGCFFGCKWGLVGWILSGALFVFEALPGCSGVFCVFLV